MMHKSDLRYLKRECSSYYDGWAQLNWSLFFKNSLFDVSSFSILAILVIFYCGLTNLKNKNNLSEGDSLDSNRKWS